MMESSLENPIYVIQKKKPVHFLSESYDYQSCQIVVENNLKIEFDLLKLSSVSPLIKSILDSFGLPMFVLGSMDIILPDSDLEELKTLQHLMSSDDGESLCLSLENWSKLQSLLDILDCRIDNSERAKPQSVTERNITVEDVADHSPDGNDNSIYDELERKDLGDELEGRRDSPVKRKKNQMVSILKSNQMDYSSRTNASKPRLNLSSNSSKTHSISQLEPVVTSNQEKIVHPDTTPRHFVPKRTSPIFQSAFRVNQRSEENESETSEASAKFVSRSVSASPSVVSRSISASPTFMSKAGSFSMKTERLSSPDVSPKPSPKPRPYSKKNGNLFAAKRSTTGGVDRTPFQVPGSRQEQSQVRYKPMPLSKKSEKMSRALSSGRSRSQAKSDDEDEISSLMNFFNFKSKGTSPSMKSEKSPIPTPRKGSGRCGCANCQINKQIKRCGNCSACRNSKNLKPCVKQLKCLKSE